MLFSDQLVVDHNVLKLVWDNTNEAIFTIGYDGRILSANPSFTAILGWEMADFNEHLYFPFFTNQAKNEQNNQLALFKQGQDIPYQVTKRVRKDGKELDILASYRAIRDGNVLAVGMYKDFTEQMNIQRRLQASEDCYRNLVEFIPDAIFVEESGKIVFVNNPASHLMGARSEKELINYPISRLVKEEASQQFEQQLKEIAGTNEKMIQQLQRLDGTMIWGEIVAMHMLFEGNEVLQVLVRDITAKKNYEEQLEFLAFHDPLTGLSNRRYFTEQINQAIEQAETDGQMLAVLYIDIDKFKSINDSLGHETGDELLKKFADRLKSTVRETDILCRIGGDEFLILLKGIKNKEEAAEIASRLNNAFQIPYLIANQPIQVTSSIGISIFPEDGLNSKLLISHSDEALYRAKNQRNTYQFYGEKLVNLK